MIIGAGIAGLLAAAACRDAGWSVVVLERDQLDGAGPRPGVPQGGHAHIYLQRGLAAAQQLVPALTAELRAAGAVPFNTAAIAWRAEKGWYPPGALTYEVLSMTRPLFESVLRRTVLEAGGIELRTGVRVSGLSTGPTGRGWHVRCGYPDAETDSVPADLVVDASGRSTRMVSWLAGLGLPDPPIRRVDARVGYATRMYADAPDLGSLEGVVVQATPERPSGAAALPVEGGRWLVGLIGYGENRPPRDEDAFAGFTARLVDPCVADFIAAASSCGGVAIHRQTENRHHHFERLRPWPEGLLPIGDSFISLNPIYGQGITVAAQQAVLLRAELHRRGPVPDTARLVRRFARVGRVPWQVATGQDRRQPTCSVPPSRFGALADRWALTVQDLAVHGDLRAYAALSRLYHLLAPPRVLLDPRLILAAARTAVRGRPEPVPRPSSIPGPPS